MKNKQKWVIKRVPKIAIKRVSALLKDTDLGIKVGDISIINTNYLILRNKEKK